MINMSLHLGAEEARLSGRPLGPTAGGEPPASSSTTLNHLLAALVEFFPG